jgi:hypothetical protein
MQSTFEWRRIAPFHWVARAENARLSAAAMWHLQDGGDFAQTIPTNVGYRGTPSIAYAEAFFREAAIALELMIKGVIAQQMEMRRADPATEGVPATHDLPALWAQAGLPKLGREDRYRLLSFKRVLMWSGRYATPRTAEAWDREIEAFAALQPPRPEGTRLLGIRPISCGWPEFDRLFQLAWKRFWELRPAISE